jgi:hypothetical protein
MKKQTGNQEDLNKFKLKAAIILISALIFSGCSLLGRKKIEDTDTYKELMRQQEETERQLDSVRRQNFRQMNDSNNRFKREMDSLKRSTDSLQRSLEKSIENLKNSKQN